MRKLFIIENQDAIRLLLQIYFERLGGYEVISAREPVACPVYLGETCECPMNSPCGDFLLLDNYLPEMTGLAYIQRQIATGCKGAVRVKAVMSAGFTAADIALAHELGCKLFPKPFRLKEIAAWVESALSQNPLSTEQPLATLPA